MDFYLGRFGVTILFIGCHGGAAQRDSVEFKIEYLKL